jgi:polysaccharide pyruvyl transferase WcaK-like protein
VLLHLWEDVLDAARAAGRADLERVIEPPVARAKRELALPANYRGRRLPGPPTQATMATAELFATPETARALAEADAVALLVGSFDGSGNFGDIAQLDGALQMLEGVGDGLLALPILERSYLADSRELNRQLLHPPAHAIFFGVDGDDDLVPVPTPSGLGFACCYLYGGGYLNASWGERKLAMLRSAEALLNSGGAERICRISSGLQVEADWIAKLGPDDAERLRGFELLGSRDPASSRALAQLGGAGTVLETGDDAIGLLGGHGAAEDPTTGDGRLHVNINFAEHEWMTGRPRQVFDFYADFLVAAGRAAERPLTVHPFLAYVDRRIDERPALARLLEALSERGVEVAEPVILRPASLSRVAPELRGSLFTLSCSYHVALSSLMLGIPAVLLQDNPYYEQKAAGLIETFGLPATFEASSADNPADSAEQISSLLLDEESGAPLRAQLARTAHSVRRRRADAEAQLLGRLAVAAPNEAERRAEEAERDQARAEAELHDILSSRSWRMAAPLRRLAARMRSSRRGR